MPDAFTPAELEKLSERWDPRERSIIQERMRFAYSRDRLDHFDENEARILRAVLERMIPQSEAVDLVGFVDWAIGRPLGRGDRAADAPPEAELFRNGLAALQASAARRYCARFDELGPEERDELLARTQSGEVDEREWRGISASLFFQRLHSRALHGYFAHPRAWMRIGFPGPAYPEGYVWVTLAQVRQRHRREPGWEML